MTDSIAGLTRERDAVRAERDALLTAVTSYRTALAEDPFITWTGAAVAADLGSLIDLATSAATKSAPTSEPKSGESTADAGAARDREFKVPTVAEVKAAAEELPKFVEKYGPAVALGLDALKAKVRSGASRG